MTTLFFLPRTVFSISDERYVEIAVDSMIVNYRAQKGEADWRKEWQELSKRYRTSELEEYSKYSLKIEREPALKQHFFNNMMRLLKKRGYLSKIEYTSYGPSLKIYEEHEM